MTPTIRCVAVKSTSPIAYYMTDSISNISFHFARHFRGDSLSVSLARHEHYLFANLDLKPGNRILNIGCGTGSVTLELAHFANVFVVGVDPDTSKVCSWVNAGSIF